jgi:hypothetical protein
MRAIPSYVLALVFFSYTPAYAYLDPGSGAMIAQLVIGGIAMVTAYFGHKFQILKRFFNRKGEDNSKQSGNDPSRDG